MMLKIECGHCGQHIEFPSEMGGQMLDCPGCHQSISLSAVVTATTPPVAPAQSQAKIVKKTEMVGAGAAVQAVGVLIFLAAFLPGLGGLSVPVFVVGLVLVIIGGRMAVRLLCSDCGTKLSAKTVKVCPACHARFV
jgi:DNA-directed RNA polymerase subunit RPC12/RpoP